MSLQNKFIEWSKKWRLDGDVIVCRNCSMRQHFYWSNYDFEHKCESKDLSPWKYIQNLIGEIKARAKTKPFVKEEK